MKYINKLRELLEKVWRVELLLAVAFITLLFAVFAVNSKIPALSADREIETFSKSQSIASIYENPVNAPYKLATYATTKFSPSVRMIRLVSFVVYSLACLALFSALKHWHTPLVSGLATLAFASNSVVLALSRLGTAQIAVFGWFIFCVLLLWQLHTRSNKVVPVIMLLGGSFLLYTPGVLWFLLILTIVFWNRIKVLYRNVKRVAVLSGLLLALIIIFPLVNAFINNPESLKEWLMLPNQIFLSEVPKSILQVPSAYIYRMAYEPLLNIGRLPIFDLAGGIVFLVGLNAYRRKIKLDRTRLMIGSFVVGIIVGALGQLMTAVVLLLPFAYSVVAAGLEFLLDEWGSVFPRNTFAKSFGIVLITSVVLFSAYYHLTRFYVVWPQTPETREIYKNSRILNES